jgi:hypothetical protein
MRKLIITAVFGILFCLNPIYVSAKTICFSMHVGFVQSFFVLSGGKIDTKPFSGKWMDQDFECTIPAWASIVTDSDGVHYISINMPHDAAANCNPGVWFHASGQTIDSMFGEIDVEQDGTYENTFSITKINCNTIEQQ